MRSSELARTRPRCGLGGALLVLSLAALSGCWGGGVDFDEGASPPTIQIVEPAARGQFRVAAPIEAAFHLDGGRGMAPSLFIVSLKRGDAFLTQVAVPPDGRVHGAESPYRATFEKGCPAPGKYRVEVQANLRPDGFRIFPPAKRTARKRIEAGVDIEVAR